jgi:hypothetical protein
MTQQTFWASLRSLTQIYALSVGGSFGITMITVTQVINILGSGGGYELASMAYIAELCVGEERTGMFGVLLGVRMLGAALGYICESEPEGEAVHRASNEAFTMRGGLDVADE